MQHRAGFYEKYIKRLLDIVLSGAALVILLPVLLITAVLVRIKLGSPVIFTQERPGKDEKVFKLHQCHSREEKIEKSLDVLFIKSSLMPHQNIRDENGNLLPDKERLTGFGKKLRSLSIDELPELWDIFRGKMSFVGPRPLLVEYLPYYTEKEHHRHDVRPGLTGLAQVNGRNTLTWEQKFAYDLEYCNDISFMIDIRIMLKTVKKVFLCDDVISGKELQKVAKKLDEERGNVVVKNDGFNSKVL